jgi:DNA-binding GntR family transcriptional regulator
MPMSYLCSASSTVEIQAPAHPTAERVESLILHGTVLELYEANLNFHRAFVHLSGNDELDGIRRTPTAHIFRSRFPVEDAGANRAIGSGAS